MVKTIILKSTYIIKQTEPSANMLEGPPASHPNKKEQNQLRTVYSKHLQFYGSLSHRQQN